MLEPALSILHRDDIQQLETLGLQFTESWQVVDYFERLLATYFDAPFAVAVDSCTHALELCLRLSSISECLAVPAQTYMSVPMMLDKLSMPYRLLDIEWEKYYALSENILDAATLWEPKSYIPGHMMCISFQFKKTLPIGRGGMILLDDEIRFEKLQRMVRDGRDRKKTQWQDAVTELGYHYYMTPEDAARGIYLFNLIKDLPTKIWSYRDYRDLRTMPYFADR